MAFIKKYIPFWGIVIAVMAVTIGISVLTTTILIQRDTAAESKQTTQERIVKVARATAKMATVKEAVQASNQGSSQNLQRFSKRLIKRDDVDFIVVLNHNLIRLSHPNNSGVGHHFSSLTDPLPALKGRVHYSQKTGVLGPEYRVFYPVYRDGRVIGVVCVGVTQKNLHAQIIKRTRPIWIGGLVGILIGVALSILLGMYLRYLLLGMEPKEIAERTARQTLIDNSLPEGIIAIDNQGMVLSANQVAQDLFEPNIIVNQKISTPLNNLLFDSDKARSTENSVEANFQDKQLLISTNDLKVRERKIGQVSMVRDVSEISGLLNKLTGTEHYISSLRAQTHEFMNQLQVINGLLELEEYAEVKKFIQQITNSYHEDVGYVSDKIKWSAMVGLLLGKSKEAKEQKISFEITADSYVPQLKLDNRVEILVLRIVSNLLDNAFAAFSQVNAKNQVTLKLSYLADESSLEICVRDNGSGITPEVRAKMFDQGFSTKGENRGYGMTLISTAVERLNGTLEVTSNQPRGSKITARVEVRED